MQFDFLIDRYFDSYLFSSFDRLCIVTMNDEYVTISRYVCKSFDILFQCCIREVYNNIYNTLDIKGKCKRFKSG